MPKRMLEPMMTSAAVNCSPISQGPLATAFAVTFITVSKSPYPSIPRLASSLRGDARSMIAGSMQLGPKNSHLRYVPRPAAPTGMLSLALGYSSAKNVQIAAASVIVVSPCLSAGTLPIGLMARYSGFMLSPLLRLMSLMSYGSQSSSSIHSTMDERDGEAWYNVRAGMKILFDCGTPSGLVNSDMRKRTVIVNDKMQKDYRYALTAPAGRGFDPEFTPQLTPAQMLKLGIFAGKYMTD